MHSSQTVPADAVTAPLWLEGGAGVVPRNIVQWYTKQEHVL